MGDTYDELIDYCVTTGAITERNLEYGLVETDYLAGCHSPQSVLFQEADTAQGISPLSWQSCEL